MSLAMTTVELQDGAVQVDAKIIADGLGIEESAVQKRLRDGKITSRCERGADEDEGRTRLTFFTADRRFQLTIDGSGNVLRRSTLNFSGRPLPDSARKPG